MTDRSIPENVAILEQKMELLESVPERVSGVELQIVELRNDMNAGLSALGSQLREEIRAGDESLRFEMRTLGETLREEIQETRRFMRILHEDVIARIAAGKG